MGETITSVSSIDHASGLPRLLFAMFAYITDSDGNINVQDVRRFQSLLKDTSWTNSADLRLGLASLQQDYSKYWAQYDDRMLRVGHEAIAKAFREFISLCEPERGEALRQGLQRFVDRVHRAPYGLRLQQRGQRNRTRAVDELQAILAARVEPTAKSVTSVSLESLSAPDVDATDVPTLWPVSRLTPASGKVWSGAKTRVRCVNIVHETHDTKTYTFTAVPYTLFHFKPGQFVTLELPINDGIVRRSYTISSSPSRPYTMSVTVKRVPDGLVSNWLYENMISGLEIDVSGPSGRFTCADHQAEKILLIGAGSGITPTMSMLRWLADTSVDVDIVFINNVRTPRDIIFEHELNYLSTLLGERLRLAIVPGAVMPGQIWHSYRGNISDALIRTLAPDFLEREVFVCGPPGYMEAVKSMLAALEFPMDHFHKESFGGAPPPRKAAPAGEPTVTPPAASSAAVAPAPANPAEPVRQVAAKLSAPVSNMPASPPAPSAVNGHLVTLKETGVSFAIASGMTILESAESGGVDLEHSCRSGICGTCRMQRIAGEIEMDEQSHLSDQDIQDGHILTCVSRAKGPVTLARIG